MRSSAKLLVLIGALVVSWLGIWLLATRITDHCRPNQVDYTSPGNESDWYWYTNCQYRFQSEPPKVYQPTHIFAAAAPAGTPFVQGEVERINFTPSNSEVAPYDGYQIRIFSRQRNLSDAANIAAVQVGIAGSNRLTPIDRPHRSSLTTPTDTYELTFDQNRHYVIVGEIVTRHGSQPLTAEEQQSVSLRREALATIHAF